MIHTGLSVSHRFSHLILTNIHSTRGEVWLGLGNLTPSPEATRSSQVQTQVCLASECQLWFRILHYILTFPNSHLLSAPERPGAGQNKWSKVSEAEKASLKVRGSFELPQCVWSWTWAQNSVKGKDNMCLTLCSAHKMKPRKLRYWHLTPAFLLLEVDTT